MPAAAGDVESCCALHLEVCFRARTALLAGFDRSILKGGGEEWRREEGRKRGVPRMAGGILSTMVCRPEDRIKSRLGGVGKKMLFLRIVDLCGVNHNSTHKWIFCRKVSDFRRREVWGRKSGETFGPPRSLSSRPRANHSARISKMA